MGIIVKLKKYSFFNFCIQFIGFSIPFSLVCMVLFMSILKGIVLGFAGGLFYAIMASVISIFLYRIMEKFRDKLSVEENILFEGAANHVISRDKLSAEKKKILNVISSHSAKREAAGGFIFLMEDYLLFKPHPFNISKEECRIPYSEIKQVTKGKMIRTIALHLHNDQIEKFVVNNRKEWICILEQFVEKED